ncbi:hypothetical protein A5708_17680 [Mycobacterium colombiense]|uniref:Integrase catalytic domain-containing protein n=2 Tax=Mycobacterium colombiense TaxID=339268 RepID=A0A1A2Z3A5_9MYCO|nr:hypothetical protein A5708_17680 [Mycobacterium colombiense]
MCRVLGVSRSGYYGWVKRVSSPPMGRAAEDAALLDKIKALHAEFSYYGAPRIHQALRRQDLIVGRHRVARIMRCNGIRAFRGRVEIRRRSVPFHRRVDLVDHVQRNFAAEQPDRLWFTDTTLIKTTDGWLYVAAILDAYNREIITWRTSPVESAATAQQALAEAIMIRRPSPGCIVHSDRGYQYTAYEWTTLARRHGMVVSIGERKDPRDNAVMESWFASLKVEELYPKGVPSSRADARQRLFTYVWIYNNKRLHSSLGYQTPRSYVRIK